MVKKLPGMHLFLINNLITWDKIRALECIQDFWMMEILID